MALQVSGPIDAAGIRTEFGATNGTSVRFGAYRVSQTVSGLENLPLDAGIPQSGPIKFSDFYNKQLNVVVDYTPVGVGTATRVTARTDYNANNSKIVVIGNFRQRPVSPAGTKIWVHTNGDLGSDVKSTTKEYCSLMTGTWDSTTDLRVYIGPSGRIAGAGGDGGAGGKVLYNGDLSQGTGSPGNNGTSALGIQHTPIIVTNLGSIISGGGGGGGGGAASGYYARSIANIPPDVRYYHAIAGGSGGGGGIGYPGGTGGVGGTVDDRYNDNDGSDAVTGNPGLDGSFTTSGNGGNGSRRSFSIQVTAAGGGGGGASVDGLGGTSNATAGTNATISQGGSGGTGDGTGRDYGIESPGNTGGRSGWAIVIPNVGTGVTITNSGTIIGITTYSTIPV